MSQLRSWTCIYFMITLVAQLNIQLANGAEPSDAVATKQESVLHIFVRRLDLAENPVEAMELRPDATFADVLAHPSLQGAEDIFITCSGLRFEPEQHLSDAGVSAESVIAIEKMSEIEMLFRMFVDPPESDTVDRFGYASYQEFAADFATAKGQRDYLVGGLTRDGDDNMFDGSYIKKKIKIVFDDESYITDITIHGTGANQVPTTINWDAVKYFRRLRDLSLRGNNLRGSIDCARFPESLKLLDVQDNQFERIDNIHEVRSRTMEWLNLLYNPLDDMEPVALQDFQMGELEWYFW